MELPDLDHRRVPEEVVRLAIRKPRDHEIAVYEDETGAAYYDLPPHEALQAALQLLKAQEHGEKVHYKRSVLLVNGEYLEVMWIRYEMNHPHAPSNRIRVLDLSKKVSNPLEKANVHTVGQILSLTRRSIPKGIGPKGIGQIRDVLLLEGYLEEGEVWPR